MNTALDDLCINTVRFLAVDMVQKANSGHPGLPLGAAPMAHALWDRYLCFDPADTAWPDRDRFVLSAGHGCALLYALLHLTGYDLPMEELQRFRQWGSRTPGHPEFGLTPGVEATTGPLGQGLTNAVGMAIAEESLAARFNRPGHKIVDHRTYVLCSDGDLMEGVSSEAASLAGHLALGKLTLLYDSNHVSIEGSTELAFTEDSAARFATYGWHVQKIEDGTDVEAIAAAIEVAHATPGRPSFIAIRTHIGYGSPNKQDTASAHGEPLGSDEVRATKQALGWPTTPDFLVPDEVRAHYREAAGRGSLARDAWRGRFEAYRSDYPDLAEEFERRMGGDLPAGWEQALPVFGADGGDMATRDAGGKVLGSLANRVPELVGGSADLAPSTKTWLIEKGTFGPGDRAGRNLHFGVREHAMGAILNGMAYHGGFVPFGSTFLIFSDYMRPPIRLAALSRLHVVLVFSHDSVALGEDGPTHQPVEQLLSLRAIPNALLVRPADANETAAAWRIALAKRLGPVLIALSRQKLPVLDPGTFPHLADGVARGGYVLADGGIQGPEIVIVATGSEVHVALEAQGVLAAEGISARVVSMPSVGLFAEQAEEYRASVLPPGTPMVTVEAGVTVGWRTYVHADAAVLGIDRFGASAPGDVVIREMGITAHAVARTVRAVLVVDA